jgi:thiol-disulfide isomerase/thioredoxin
MSLTISERENIMKLLIINIIFLFSIDICTAQTVNFESSLKTAFEKAKHENKLVFVEYYNEECPVCQKLEPVFRDSALSKFYNEHFINYKLNTENIKKEDSLFILGTGLKFESVPYFLFFDEHQNFVHYSGTKQDIEYLVTAGKTALDPKERTAELANKYKAGDRSIRTLYAYSNLLQLYKDDSLRTIIADELFRVFPEKELGTQKSYVITKNCVASIENGFFIYWIKHIDEFKGFEKKANTSHPTNVLGDILLKSINGDQRKSWDLQKINAVKKMIMETELSKNPNAFFWEQESMLLVKDNRSNEALDLFRQVIVNDSDNITAAVYVINYYLNILAYNPDLKIIKTWIDKLSAKKMSNADKGSLMYCSILFYKKIKDKKMAKEIGQSALLFYKDNNIDATMLNELLSDL